MKNKIQQVQTWTITPGERTFRSDMLVAEEPLEIRLAFGSGQGRKRFSVAVTMRTPGDDEDLAIGFLFTEGIIAGRDAVIATRWLDEHVLLVELHPDVYVDEERLVRHFFTSSSCGICGKASLEAVRTITSFYPVAGSPVVSPDFILQLPGLMSKQQETFASTGGLHATVLFDLAGNLLYLREDVGRHNAMDKVIGAALRAGHPLPFRENLVMVSGRAGFELIQKASMAGVPILAAVGAPSGLAVALAEASNMSLIGFLREKRFNIYSSPERIA